MPNKDVTFTLSEEKALARKLVRLRNCYESHIASIEQKLEIDRWHGKGFRHYPNVKQAAVRMQAHQRSVDAITHVLSLVAEGLAKA